MKILFAVEKVFSFTSVNEQKKSDKTARSMRKISYFSVVSICFMLVAFRSISSPKLFLNFISTAARSTNTTDGDRGGHNNETLAVVAKNITSFFFVHIPKTGTGFLTLLRNRLPSCTIKGFSCIGGLGGGLPGGMTVSGKGWTPYTSEFLNLTGKTKKEQKSINTCDGALPQCGSRLVYHVQYAHCRNKENKVTLFREPHAWFSSILDFMYVFWSSQPQRNRRELNLPFTSQIKFTTNTKRNVSQAMQILQNEYIFWGITGYWNATVCIFHCELGGPWHSSETINVRSAHEFPMKTPVQAWDSVRKKGERTIRLPDELVPNRTQYVEEHYAADLELYYANLLPLFQKRADKCNCALS